MDRQRLSKPLFVIGSPRSGTTLLRLMINAHPHILVPPENGGFIVYWYDKYKDWRKEDLLTNRVNEYVDDLLSTKKMDTWQLSKDDVLKFIHEIQPENYAILSSCAYLAYAEKIQKELNLWGDKNNYLIKHVDTLYALFPNAYFIYFVRDGRDVACSYKKLQEKKFSGRYAPNLPNEIAEIASHWLANNQAAMSSFDKMPSTQVLTCRYEDLVTNMEHEARRICAFVNEEYSDKMLRYNELNDEPDELLPWKEKVLQKPDTSTIGRYKEELTEEELQEFEQRTSPILKKLGY